MASRAGLTAPTLSIKASASDLALPDKFLFIQTLPYFVFAMLFGLVSWYGKVLVFCAAIVVFYCDKYKCIGMLLVEKVGRVIKGLSPETLFLSCICCINLIQGRSSSASESTSLTNQFSNVDQSSVSSSQHSGSYS